MALAMGETQGDDFRYVLRGLMMVISPSDGAAGEKGLLNKFRDDEYDIYCTENHSKYHRLVREAFPLDSFVAQVWGSSGYDGSVHRLDGLLYFSHVVYLRCTIGYIILVTPYSSV